MKHMFALGLLSFSIAGLCQINSGAEQLLGVSIEERGISFQVRSHGCTFRRDFDFNVEEKLESMGPNLPAFEHHHYITVKRVRPDVCESFQPRGTRIFIGFEELGIEFGKYHVNNPIGGELLITP